MAHVLAARKRNSPMDSVKDLSDRDTRTRCMDVCTEMRNTEFRTVQSEVLLSGGQ